MRSKRNIFCKIAELESKRAIEQDRINGMIAGCRKAMQDASAVMEVTDEPDEYEAAKEAVAKNKTAIELYNRKLSRICLLDANAYKELKRDIMDEYNRDTEATAQAAFDALMSLIDMLDEYCKRSADIRGALDTIGEFAGIGSIAQRGLLAISDNNINIAKDDRYTWYRAFMQFYHQHKGKVDVMNRYGVKS